MDPQRVKDILSGEDTGLAAKALRTGLLLAEGPYRLVMILRRWAYTRGLLPSAEAEAPVISVGNITTGGTGKTPMVAWLVRRLCERGRHPAVLMRGYKAVDKQSDEAVMLRIELGRPAGLLPLAARRAITAAIPSEVPVFARANRRVSAAEAIAAGANVLVLDDGFQHLRLRRNLDIVLIDATCPFGFGHVLPRGLLREPLSALKSADVIVITRADAVDASTLASLQQRLAAKAPQASFHLGAHQATRLVDTAGGPRDLAELADKRVLAFCGLGNPQQFFQTLQNLHVNLVATHAFEDHTTYGPRELGMLQKLAGKTNADVLVTTQKDGVKLHPGWLTRPVWKLSIELEIIQGREELLARIEAVLPSNHESQAPAGSAGITGLPEESHR